MMAAPKLKTLARMIQAKFGNLVTVTVQPWTVSTDRQIGRLRWPGKGRKGYRLLVRVNLSTPTLRREPFLWDHRRCHILDHKSGETYRTNAEVVDWMERTTVEDVKRSRRHIERELLKDLAARRKRQTSAGT
jgi:hypothetical protein